MGKTVFIADQSTRYGRKIADRFLGNDYQVIRASAGMEEHESGMEENMLVDIEWNCYSTFSSKNIVLELRKFEKIDYHIIVYSFPQNSGSVTEQSYTDIQKDMDCCLRSQVFLTRDIINAISGQKEASLFLIIDSSGQSVNPYRDFIRSFVSTVLEDVKAKELQVNAFETRNETAEIFADFIYSTIAVKGVKSHGKWIRPFQVKSLLDNLSLRNSMF